VNGVVPNQGTVSRAAQYQAWNGDKNGIVNGVAANHGVTDNTAPNVETRTSIAYGVAENAALRNDSTVPNAENEWVCTDGVACRNSRAAPTTASGKP
jgi:hypothetical protein